MSGGVDSSVAAALLKKEGYDVTEEFFKPWAPFAKASEGHSNPVFYCDWQQDRRDAMAVAEILSIPFKTWDFSKEYKNKVGDYMIESYRKGLTPNPDVMCNKEIKFGLFLKKARQAGADFIATGHYVRKTQNRLLTAIDKNKDQSYFLWALTQKQLKYCLFPIGDYTKPKIRQLAKKFGLPTFNKKDSQGVCFIGQLDMKEFLKKYIPSKPGQIILHETAGNKLIGTHEGAAYYTIGQRHGLNITNGGGPYYVSDKDLKKNLVFVTKEEQKLETKEIAVQDINWINSISQDNLQVKARYRTSAVSAKIVANNSNHSLKIKTAKPLRAATPGQSVVFYHGQEMLGGGIITVLTK